MANVDANSISSQLRMDKEKIHDLYWNWELHQREIAELYGCSRSLIDKLSKELGLVGVKTSSRNQGKRNQNYKGGSFICRRGYVCNRAPEDGWKNNGWKSRQKYEHIMIAEKVLGRKLRDGETIHHINGIKTDNRHCNLIICSNAYHGWLEKECARRYKLEHFGKIEGE